VTDLPERRKPLTALQRLALFEEHKGICCICGEKIDGTREKWIDEHGRALGLLGSNDLSNRGPAHVRCAQRKTSKEDLPRIAKAKRQKAVAVGAKQPAGTIKSAGFRPGKSRKKHPMPMPPRPNVPKGKCW
jgi:5-methylcytosine-specific restriction protein A